MDSLHQRQLIWTLIILLSWILVRRQCIDALAHEHAYVFLVSQQKRILDHILHMSKRKIISSVPKACIFLLCVN